MILRGSHHHLQFLPLWERDSASTSGTSTPVRITDFKLTAPTTTISLSPRDSESADDEGSGNEENTPTKLSTPSKKRKSNRIPPEGEFKVKIRRALISRKNICTKLIYFVDTLQFHGKQCDSAWWNIEIAKFCLFFWEKLKRSKSQFAAKIRSNYFFLSNKIVKVSKAIAWNCESMPSLSI